MTEQDDRSGGGGGEGKVVAFLLGFLAGVLVCLGAGGAYFVLHSQAQAERMRALEMEARMEAEAARHQAAEAERRAREAEQRARKE